MLLDRLKRETAEIHARLERDLNLADPFITREKYLTLLTRFYGFYQPVENSLRDALSAGLAYLIQQRTKLGKLVDDLLFLGVPAELLHQTPQIDAPPAIGNPVQALGVMYVLEGSTLGGQVIVRQVRSSLQLIDGRGCSFFESYGSEVGRMWQSFRQVLLAHSAPQADDEMVTAAMQTFQSLHEWLCPEGRVDHAFA